MKLDGKLKGGLAWAGLVVILAVPAADIVLGPRESAQTVTAVPAETATADKPKASVPARPATDAVQTASISTDPVKSYLDKNKTLPSYVSDGNGAATNTASLSGGDQPPLNGAKPLPVPTEMPVAATAPPPVPLPRTARPKVAAETELAALPQPAKPAQGPVLILDEKAEARAKAVSPFPLSDGDAPRDTASVSDEPVVTADQLEEWDSGSLAQYLERKGLLDETPNADAGSEADASSDYDPDGFFLDEGPNAGEPKRKRLDELWFF